MTEPVTEPDADWEWRLAALWADLDTYAEPAFRDRMLALTAELPPGSPVALFENGGARDSTGDPDRAVQLYTAALAAGLQGIRRRRAVIQLASSKRNLGAPEEALRLLTAEAAAGSDELDGALATFRALVLADLGREREGLSVALTALSAYLPRYHRSVARYAQALLDPPQRDSLATDARAD